MSDYSNRILVLRKQLSLPLMACATSSINNLDECGPKSFVGNYDAPNPLSPTSVSTQQPSLLLTSQIEYRDCITIRFVEYKALKENLTRMKKSLSDYKNLHDKTKIELEEKKSTINELSTSSFKYREEVLEKSKQLKLLHFKLKMEQRLSLKQGQELCKFTKRLEELQRLMDYQSEIFKTEVQHSKDVLATRSNDMKEKIVALEEASNKLSTSLRESNLELDRYRLLAGSQAKRISELEENERKLVGSMTPEMVNAVVNYKTLSEKMQQSSLSLEKSLMEIRRLEGDKRQLEAIIVSEGLELPY